ncbi:MAG: branched-chain amino acid ABC transporter permease [Proteobacteria bacterium]|nr:branched-chain amino acid ABC transporter permease [Desulfobacterales bacterium]MBL7171411.1 branched-chain amino acid ABC transporter permease [Desulfobacteraceae bacterium]MBU0734014.1 branched-chain amino acid ABC transporter permease [Pseudomonadota bacterium]MBU1902690.1 branched-chain amino acid ABC transporter permease [Pseudomonadota bacterium]
MEFGHIFTFSALGSQFLVGLSRAMILFIVSSGMSLVLGVLRVPNVAHGSLYMIGAFSAFSISSLFGGGSAGFWLALLLAPIVVALVSFVAERSLFCHLYEREHLMLLLFTFALMLILGDLVKMFWGADYRSIMAPEMLRGSVPIFGSPFPKYNLFLLIVGPLVAILLWLFTNKTKTGKISRAAAVDMEMVGAIGINVSWVFAFAFVLGCLLAGLGGALVSPMVSITLGMDHDIIMEAFLIVAIGGLGNMWGALVGSLIFGLTQSFGVLFWPQFAIVFPYAAVVIVLTWRPKGILKSVW